MDIDPLRRNAAYGSLMTRLMNGIDLVLCKGGLKENLVRAKILEIISQIGSSKNSKWTRMITAALAFVFGGVVAEAQQATKVPRIGYLGATSPVATAARLDAFKQGLRELGYVEGKSILIDYRWAEGKFDRIPGLAAELVRLAVDVIVTAGPADTKGAKEATSTIPIVMGFDNDPVGNGFVASLARPGGNITGLSTLAPEISGKQLELMKEIVRRLSRVAIFGTSRQPGNAQSLQEVELAAKAFKVKLQYLDVLDAKDVETAFRAATKDRADAILVLQTPIASQQRAQFVDLAVKHRLPATYSRPISSKPAGS